MTNETEANPEPFTIEEGLEYLGHFGRTNLMNLDSGWYAKVGMFVPGECVTFDIASNFGFDSPLSAVRQLCLRVEATTKALRMTPEDRERLNLKPED